MSETPLIIGFIKVRNEIIRSNNIYRCILNLQQYCDEIYAIDDASYDGTFEYLQSVLPDDHIIRVPSGENDFRDELKWKQLLLDLVHSNGPHHFIYWQDADEVLDDNGTQNIRAFCKEHINHPATAYSFHYTQLWRNSSYARVDDGFDDGWFIKLWKYTPALKFNIQNGTHHQQFPVQAGARIEQSPFEVIHYGNFSCNLRWKCIQYYGGLGGVDRHLLFDHATYRKVNPTIFPQGVEHVPSEELPKPFTSEQVERIRSLRDLKNLEKTFCVVIPTRNRGYVLERTLNSVLAQTYDKWIVVVLDDASTDNTPEIVWKYQEQDPRIFYARYLTPRGGVAVNEVGCEIAINTCEYWTRLGSDDFFMPNKLERDAYALQMYNACYGPFVVYRDNKFAEVCSPPILPNRMREVYLKGGFEASWANIACRTSVLKDIKSKFGSYVDPRIVNMEDRLMNFRMLKFTDIVWRGSAGGKDYVNPTEEQIAIIHSCKDSIQVDAAWTSSPADGSSYKPGIYEQDYNLTTSLINKEKDL